VLLPTFSRPAAAPEGEKQSLSKPIG
jgi:hypothetical protein